MKIGFITNDPRAFVWRKLEDEFEAIGGVEKVIIGASMKGIYDSLSDMPSYLIILTEEFKTNANAARYLNNICKAEGKKVIVIGYRGEVDSVKQWIDPAIISETFFHPINIRDVAVLLAAKIKGENTVTETKHLLVVDDSGMMLRTVMKWFEGIYRVSLANSAASAMKVISTDKPDLILLDYEMPGCSGGQFFKMLKAEKKLASIPVIFLTAKGDQDTVRSVLSLKPEGYILKSTPSSRIISIVEDYFKTHER